MTALDAATARARAEAMRAEREAQRSLTLAYRAILARLQGDLDALTTRLAAAQAAGETVGQSWLLRNDRYRALIAQTEVEIGRYSRTAEAVIANGQRQAATAALSTSEAVMAAALGTPPPGVVATFNRLPTGAIEELVGNLGDGKPLSVILSELGPLAAEEGRRAILEGIGIGLSPRQIAREFRLGTNTSAVRALRISRQEINRAYRSASLENYRANADVVTGWRWLCAGGKRTCGLCYAMSGKEFKLDQPFASHVACRCTVVPICKEIPGYTSLPQSDDGPTVFGRLSDEDQRAILGRGKYELFKSGDMSLDDLVQGTRSTAWGPGRRERTLAEVRALPPKVPALLTTASVPRFKTLPEAIGWLENNLTHVVIPGKHNLAAMQSVADGLNDVLTPHGVRLDGLDLTSSGKDKKALGRYIATGGSKTIALQPTATATAKGATVAAEKAQRVFAEQRAIQIAQYEKYVADPKRAAILAHNQAKLDRLRASTRWASYADAPDPIRAVAAHEAAHAVYFTHGIDKIWPHVIRGISPVDMAAVSDYGATSAVELFAEAYTSRVSGIPLPRLIDDALTEVLRGAK